MAFHPPPLVAINCRWLLHQVEVVLELRVDHILAFKEA
jgi:hypothetical protein